MRNYFRSDHSYVIFRISLSHIILEMLFLAKHFGKYTFVLFVSHSNIFSPFLGE